MPKITVTLDTDDLDTHIDLWQQTVDMQIPIADHIKVHLMAKRREILLNMKKTASSYSLVLGSMTPAGQDREAFAQLLAKVKNFQTWAEKSLQELQDLAGT